MATPPSSVKISKPTASTTKQSTQGQQPANKSALSQGTANVPWPWKTLLGLGLILVELWFQTGYISGLFMLLWAIIGIHSGQTYILEILNRQVHPILFWITIHLWLLLAAALFMSNNRIYAVVKILIIKVVNLF